MSQVNISVVQQPQPSVHTVQGTSERAYESGYEAPQIVDLGAWQVVTGSIPVPCDPSGCDIGF